MTSTLSTRMQTSRTIFGLGAILTVALILLSGTPPSLKTLAQQEDSTYDGEMRNGQDLLRRRKYEEALKAFKRACEVRGKESAECYLGMAQAYYGLDAYKNVAETCDKVILMAAGNNKVLAQAYSLKGVSLESQSQGKDQKKLQEAETAFRQGIALSPETPSLHYNLGFTLMQLSRDPEGVAELKKYLELAPNGGDAAEAQKLIANPRRAREAYAPDFSMTSAAGEFISSDDLHGKVVLLDFWGTWCPPCVASLPAVRDLNKRYSKDKNFVMISVDVRDEEQKWRDFIDTNKMTWFQYRDRDGKVQRAFEVRGFPTYILIDHEGILRWRGLSTSWERTGELDDALKKYLKLAAKSSPSE